MAVLVTIPVQSLSPGTLGPFSAAMPNAPANWVVTFTKGASWPASGKVMDVLMEESNDNGSNWQFSASLDLSGGPWKDRAGNTVTVSAWSTTPLFRSATARVRVRFDVAQACQLGATVST